MDFIKGGIVVIGAGKKGEGLLKVLVEETGCSIIGVYDMNPDAPGLDIARKFNIPVTNDYKELLAKNPDVIINLSGDDILAYEVRKLKSPNSEVLDIKCAKLIQDLLEKRHRAEADVRNVLNATRDLYRIGVALTSADQLEEGLENLLIVALRTLNAPAGSIALYDETDETLRLKTTHGFSDKLSGTVQWKRRSGGITDHILGKKIPTIISDIHEHEFAENEIISGEGIRSLVAVPLFSIARTIGILYIDDFKPREWTKREIEFITLLGIQASYAIEKFRFIDTISETKTYLKNVLNNSADIIITADTEGRIVEFNSGAARLLGYDKEDMIGKKAEYLWLNRDERKDVIEMLEKQGYVSNYETKFVTKDAGILEVSLTLSYIKNDEGKILGTVGISKDITEKKRLERAVEERNIELQELNNHLEDKVLERTAALEKLNKDLETSNKLKSQFIATMSHELRTPLNSILGFSELLMDEVFGLLTEKQKKYASNIYNSGSHLLQLINNILDIAKIESGKMELHYENFSIYQSISEVETVIKSIMNKKKQSLILKLSENIPFIRADRIKVKQILHNLLSNAVKFTPEGGEIVLEAEIMSGRDDALFLRNSKINMTKGNCLRISVIDTGIGIKKEDQERIFSEFEQVESGFARRYEGTGLGLALTKKLVELHGGEINLESAEGTGSRFNVILPLFDLMIPKKMADEIIEEQSEEIPYEGAIVKKRRGDSPLILVVEDDRSTSELLTIYLVKAGYRVAHAYNGEDAMNRIKELKPFAVILDVMLPGKDGWEVLQEVKLDQELKDIPIIMSSVIDNRDLGFTLGAADYLLKPIDKMTLLKKLDELSFSSKKGRMPINILCIDDNKEVLELLSTVLQANGYNVITASSGKKGIESANIYMPDLIILDLMMPDVDGFEVVQKIKSKSATKDIPILVLTAKDITMEDRLRLAGKIEKYIQKSHFTKEDLLMHIRDLEITYPARAGLLDEVSGLFDHCYFHIRLAQEVSRSGRYKNTLTVVMVDIDNFTEYIKSHGIHRANICIKKIADFLRKSLRGSDTVVRYGIDEFALILPNTLKESAHLVARRTISFIDGYPFYGEEVMPKGKLTASASIINYPKDVSTPEELIFKSRQSLRKAKLAGGGRVEVYEKET